MNKERLFELIRQEQVILFAGAGISLYAGFPSGERLKEIMHKSLKEDEINVINYNQSLQYYAEEFCRIKNDNRKSLNRILLNEFRYRKPTSLDWHKKLAQISHIKTIITTNYDELFEKGYGDKCRKVFKSSQINDEEKQTDIYKIHGDIKDLNSIIITNSDYNNFFIDKKEESIFWNVIKTKMATNCILFIGYSLEDSNVSVVLNKIINELGENKKELFFISPNQKEHNIIYLKKLGITYINMRSENFLKEITKSLENNIVTDFNNNKISSKTLINYSKNHDLFPSIIYKDGKEFVSSFKGIKKEINPELTINFNEGWDFQKEIAKHNNLQNFDKFEIDIKKIADSKLSYANIKMPDLTLLKLELNPKPNINTIVDLRFDNDFEYNDVKIKLFKKNNYAEIKADLKNSNYTLKIDLSKSDKNINVIYTHNEFCGNLKDEIEELNLMINIGSGINFNIFPRNYNKLHHDSTKNEELIKYARNFLEYFLKLKKIENHYNVKFGKFKFDSISENNEQILNKIISVINNECIELDWNGYYKVELNESDRKIFISENFGDPIFPYQNPEIIKLHNIDINIGYKIVQLPNSVIINKKEILSKVTKIAKFKSSVNKLLIRYIKEPITI